MTQRAPQQFSGLLTSRQRQQKTQPNETRHQRGSAVRHKRQRDAALVLVLARLVLVAGAALGLGLEEEDLRDAFAGVDLRRERGGVGGED